MQTIQASASKLCQLRSKTSWRVICPSNNLYLKQTSSIQNTAHMALACSFCHHTSARNLNWDILNDSDFKAWVKCCGRPCSGSDTFTSSYTKPWSLWWIFKSITCKINMVCTSDKTRQSHIDWPPKVDGNSTWDCTRNIPSTIQLSIFLGASVIILTSSLLKRVDLSVEILSPSIWTKVKGTDVRG